MEKWIKTEEGNWLNTDHVVFIETPKDRKDKSGKCWAHTVSGKQILLRTSEVESIEGVLNTNVEKLP